VGSPPGYVGFDEGGQLTEKVRRKPYSVILFDEIEKAHPDVFNIMLQILDDGMLTDSKGRRVDFKNTVIIMTSNIGAADITDTGRRALGFGSGNDRDATFAEISSRVMTQLRQAFRPEFLNRVDDIIVFHRLERSDIRAVAALRVEEVRHRLEQLGISLQCTDGALDVLAEKGYDPSFGARPLKRVVQSLLEDRAAELLLAGTAGAGCTLEATAEDGEIRLRVLPGEA